MQSKQDHPFKAPAFLESAGVAWTRVMYRRSQTIFLQGDACESVMYLQSGNVKLSVRSKFGKVAVVATLGPGAFFGEGSLAGQPCRMETATAVTATTLLIVENERMLRLLHEQRELADTFIAHMLGTNIRIERNLLDQLFNHDEKRLAQTLLLLARFGTTEGPKRRLANVSEQKLAEMSGTTRSNVAFFMKKFKRLGFIDNLGGLTVNDSLLTIVLHE